MSPRLPSPRLVVATALVALAASSVMVAARPTTLVVDGARVASEAAPVTAGSVAYLPVTAVADAAGADAHVDGTTITLRHAGRTLVAHVGHAQATLDGRPVTLAHAPLASGRDALVAGDDLARLLGARIRYDAARARVDVRTPGVVVAPAADSDDQ